MRQQESNQHHSSMLCITVYSTTVFMYLSLPSAKLLPRQQSSPSYPTDLRVSTIIGPDGLDRPFAGSSPADVPVNEHDVIVSDMILPVIWSVLLEMT
jgi:hypothetical protein